MRRFHAAALVLAAALVHSAAARAQQVVFVVRHAEKISTSDERLSDAGRTRAARLAALLADAGVTAVYSTDTERTRDTAKPLADARRLSIRIYEVSGAAPDAAPFVERLRRESARDRVLVVGHSNTIPEILRALGCPGTVTMGPDEYDDLFVVVPNGEHATLVRLKY